MRNLVPELVKSQIRSFNQETKRINGGRYIRAWADELFCLIRYGSTPSDYYQYEFHKLRGRERDRFVTWRRSQKLIRENGPDCGAIVEKDRFNRRFEKYLNRDWIDLQTASVEDFQRFLERHGRAFMKPLGGACGKGMFILTKEDFAARGNDLAPYRAYIAEELIVQHEVLRRLNPCAVNTIRVLTYRGEILLAVLKLGTGKNIVDNRKSNGLNGNIDLETGITNSVFYDLDYHPFYRHPDTKEILLGVQIPFWDELKATVKEAALALPEVPYLGWDVAVTPTGIAIVETNEEPGHKLSQGASKTGVYQEIRRIKKQLGKRPG